MQKSAHNLAETVRIEYREMLTRYARHHITPLKQYAVSHNLNIARLAALLCVHPRTLSLWISATRIPVSKASWDKIDSFQARHPAAGPTGSVWEAIRK